MSLVRLACVRHAASVHPEPGSNSQIEIFGTALGALVLRTKAPWLLLTYYNYDFNLELQL